MNRAIFVDTAYVYAVLNFRNQWHLKAAAWQKKIIAERRALIITEFVLIEIADGLAAINYRQTASQAIRLFDETRWSKSFPPLPICSDAP